MEALIARVEGASGPDRELDGWIWWHSGHLIALCPEAAEQGSPALAVGYYSGRSARIADADLTMASVTPAYKCPSYTASIDAAMSLVPKGLSFEVRSSGTGDKGQATVWDPMRAVGVAEWRVTGCATPALALCAAALRARTAKETDDGD